MPCNSIMTGTGLELARCYQYLAASCPELVHNGWWVTHYLMLSQSISIVHCSNSECIFGPVTGIVHHVGHQACRSPTQSLAIDMRRLFLFNVATVVLFPIGEESDDGHRIKRALYIGIKRLWPSHVPGLCGLTGDRVPADATSGCPVVDWIVETGIWGAGWWSWWWPLGWHALLLLNSYRVDEWATVAGPAMHLSHILQRAT